MLASDQDKFNLITFQIIDLDNEDDNDCVSYLRQAHEDAFRYKRPFYKQVASNVSYVQRHGALEPFESLPTMLHQHRLFQNDFLYASREHNYCNTVLHRPPGVKWKCYRNVPKTEDMTVPPPLSNANKALLAKLSRPNYVMSEPWLFVPALDNYKGDVSMFKESLGFETVLKQLLGQPDKNPTCIVFCAKCDLDFSSEWFTFMSQRLCRACYKDEVKTRNSIIYLTNMTNIARKSHKLNNT